MPRKAQVEILSQIILTAVFIFAAVAAYLWARPLLAQFEDADTFYRMKSWLMEFDNTVREVVYEGPSSTRTLFYSYRKGAIIVDQNAGNVTYSLPTQVALFGVGASLYERPLYYSRGLGGVNMWLSYKNSTGSRALQFKGITSFNTGSYQLVIKNNGVNNTNGLPIIDLTLKAR